MDEYSRIIAAAKEGNTVDMRDAVNNIMAVKVADVLSNVRQEQGNAIFNSGVEDYSSGEDNN